MTNNEIKKNKASVLAVTMIVLGLVLSIALSASLVSILGNKASVSSNKSNLAYSRADSGIEDVLLRIKNADPDIDTVANIDTDGNCDGIVNGTNFKVELKDEAGILVSGDCSTKVSEIRSIKSTGIADNNQRSIEVAVAASSGLGAWETNGHSNIYHATTDGFVVAYCWNTNSGTAGGCLGYTDSDASPATQRGAAIIPGSGIGYGTITMPVKKGDYWIINLYGGNSGGTVYWIPLGS